MANLTLTGAYQRTARKDIHEIARELTGALGPTLVAALTGSKDRKLPSKWAQADGPRPSDAFARRLLLAHRTWLYLVSNETEHVARQWFIGGNPHLGEATPLTAIREDRGAEVSAAAEAFAQGIADE